LKQKGVSIIAELKRKSPSAGVIKADFAPETIALKYQECGAQAISVLTDRKFFGGMPEFIARVKRQVRLPVLRKEFIIDESQLYESRIIGADAVLLIARILSAEKLAYFLELAGRLDIAVLVEVHTRPELARACAAGARMIGVNNRDLDTLVVNKKTALELKKHLPDDILAVAESGIRSAKDIRMLKNVGFDAVLIGEVLMRAKDIRSTIEYLRRGIYE
jgi:indole-3-glycerol phosphate synthase